MGLLPEDNMLAIISIMLTFGFVLYELGERLPIWNDYIGGGAVMAFFGAAAFEFYGVIPEKYATAITFFYDDYGFQTLFISLLIVSAVLTVNRKQLLKAFSGYIPAILGGIGMAAIFGIIGAMICGVEIDRVIAYYVLPIMGGGNGGGALPISEMWEQSTGKSKEEFYSVAFAILNIANNFAILGAVGLNILGNKYPKLTGNGELLKNPEKYSLAEDHAPKPKIGLNDIGGGLLVTCAIYALSYTVSEFILPSIGPVSLHMYVYTVIFAAILNVANLIPAEAKLGAKRLSEFFTKPLMCMCMCGIGIAFMDLADFIAALSWQNFLIAAMIVLGAIIGSGAVGMMVGFNFVESAMTAGLCMANRGGSGDLQVLGAGKRMSLMSYAQISSRIGGAIILILCSIIFGFMA
ncbi:hypothetical protein AN639_07560 [Candidatus Epulonipiscium fishelsonii]|uniref:Uncharacterized protein n=1 Tax=Candidatus Epulonipiscium fishelsonii TaxID=77094 RepID=A0ACC8XF67_9FIRM|nr:hypothetical protein AN639_07560 [Epulopiscium sp. SCG-B05WGA-EpuloA1]ONI41911.1 hypothetical protein AN396_02810 [Epulopiscium sp. SCG-B11WGA-EpuloA1]